MNGERAKMLFETGKVFELYYPCGPNVPAKIIELDTMSGARNPRIRVKPLGVIGRSYWDRAARVFEPEEIPPAQRKAKWKLGLADPDLELLPEAEDKPEKPPKENPDVVEAPKETTSATTEVKIRRKKDAQSHTD